MSAGAPSGSRVSAPDRGEVVPHKNGSGAHRLVLPPVRRGASTSRGSETPDAGSRAPTLAPPRSSDPKLLYMTPTLQNPTNAVMGEARRAAIGRPDELSAIYHNPGALALLPGTRIGISFPRSVHIGGRRST